MKLEISIKAKNDKVILNLILEDKPCRGGWMKTFIDEEVLFNGQKSDNLINYWATDLQFYELEANAKKGYLSTTLREICLIHGWEEAPFIEDILEISRKKDENKKIIGIKLTTKKGIELYNKLENPIVL